MTAAATDETTEEDPAGPWFGSLGSVLYLLLLAWGGAIAAFPMDDNSFFTHLATGRIILDQGSVPTADPYTFTAAGEAWTVQSWLASVTYAGAEQLAGGIGLRLVMAAVMTAAVTVLWKLTAPADSVLARTAVAGACLFAVTDLWSERPYMIGVIGLGLVWLALEGRLRNRWLLVPLFWVWGNTHGSYPLAFVLIGAVLVGALIDQRGHGRDGGIADELGVLRWSAIGIASAVIGPLFVDVLLFPLQAARNSTSFSYITEWNPPKFESVPELAFLALVLAGIAASTRLGSWRRTLPLIIFAGAALYAQRNVVMAVMVLAPVLAEAAPRLGTLRVWSRPALGGAVSAVVGVVAVLSLTLALVTAVQPFGGYPVASLAYVDANSAGGNVLTEDIVGNLLEVLDGPTGTVFIDDRADMFPEPLFEDYVALVRGEPDWEGILDRYGIDQVVWSRDRPLTALLAADEDWAVSYGDVRAIVACRRGSCPASSG